MARVTHKHIGQAVARLNERKGLAYPAIGYLLYQDVRGEGGAYSPSFYQVTNEAGGVTSVARQYRKETHALTVEHIDTLTDSL